MISYLKLIKFSHTIFSFPFALIGFLFALDSGYELPSWLTITYIVLAIVFARTTAMDFNRWADWKIDLKNPRTKNREIPKGIIKPKQALNLTIISSVIFIILAGLINELCLWLSPLALFIILFYSYSKRFTYLTHFILGIALGIAPAATYIAVTGSVDPQLILLCLAVVFWVSGFDIIYSLQDQGFDNENNLFSIPAKFGTKKSLRLSAVLHIMSIIMLFLFWLFVYNSYISLIGIILFAIMLIYQHIDIRKNGLKKINLFFGIMNGSASTILGIFYLIDFLI